MTELKDKTCSICGRSLDIGMVFIGCEIAGVKNFEYLEAGESVHIECYIEKTIKMKLAKMRVRQLV